MTMNKGFGALVIMAVLFLMAPGSSLAGGAFCDNFDDGTLDPSLWQTGGMWGGFDWGGPWIGDWRYEHSEISLAGQDGYLRTRVWGPATANAYQAMAWARTAYNYNDGQNHAINFSWAYHKNAGHWENLAIQITNGILPENTTWNVSADDGATWRNLYHRYDYGCPDQAQVHWSIGIDAASRTATLYDHAGLTGSIIGAKVLPSDQAWQVQFLHADGSSAGYPGGDNSLDLYYYDSVPEPSGLSLLVLGGLMSLRRR